MTEFGDIGEFGDVLLLFFVLIFSPPWILVTSSVTSSVTRFQVTDLQVSDPLVMGFLFFSLLFGFWFSY